jgi:hypothetical protein
MSWLGNWAWAPGLGLLMTFALLLFPDGRLPSRRWRPVAWLSGASIAMICGLGGVWSWPQRRLGLLESNQEGLENAPRLVELLVLAGLPLLLLCGLASVVALLLRLRRSRGAERQQLKWFAFAGAVTFAGLVLWVVAGATLAVAALFQPARLRIQQGVDRRFNRRKYNTAQTIDAFSTRLRDQVDLDTLSAGVLGVVDQTMQPTTASLWLRDR